MRKRASGILLHLTSLPGEYGVGDLGPWAYRFADFLHSSGQSVWQFLPIGPTSPAIGNSPYSSFSAFAGNPLFISPELLIEEGFITAEELPGHLTFSPYKADYESSESFKFKMLEIAFAKVRSTLADEKDFTAFVNAHDAVWLHDYALFRAIKDSLSGQMWTYWPVELRDRHPEAIQAAEARFESEILFTKFVQYLFFKQWYALKAHANAKQVFLVGDAPIYVTLDSADVWSNPGFFKLSDTKTPTGVAGVPPDYFSETGQLWGNPVYNWDALAADGYRWWVERVRHNISLFDYVRIDHFRGFAGFWEVPYGEKTAINGAWVDAPGMDFFDTLNMHFPSLPIIAEDLGVITPDVRELRDTFGLPGMKILQFCFGPGIGDNGDALHNHVRNCVVYTGTHDNNTTRGWFRSETSEDDRKRLFAYLGSEIDENDASWALIRLAMSSVAQLAVYPMQDLLSLDESARMNTPSVAEGNWRWRMLADDMENEALVKRLGAMTELFGRGVVPR